MLFGLGLPSVVTLVYFVLLGDDSAGVQQVAYGIGKGVQFGFPVFWVFYIRRNRPQWHLPGRHSLLRNRQLLGVHRSTV